MCGLCAQSAASLLAVGCSNMGQAELSVEWTAPLRIGYGLMRVQKESQFENWLTS